MDKDAYLGFLNLTHALITNNKFFPNFLCKSTRGDTFKFIYIQTKIKSLMAL